MVRADALLQLLAHLADEAECLTALEATLAREAEALRRLDLPALADAADEKARLADRHAGLAPHRAACLQAVAARPVAGLGDLLAELPAPDAERVAESRERLRALAGRVAAAHRRNVLYAETGRAVIAGALRAVGRQRRVAAPTYAADGRIDGRLGPAALVREQG